MTATQESDFKRLSVKISSEKWLIEDISYSKWTWLGGRLDNESKKNGVKHDSELRDLPIVKDRWIKGKVYEEEKYKECVKGYFQVWICSASEVSSSP